MTRIIRILTFYSLFSILIINVAALDLTEQASSILKSRLLSPVNSGKIYCRNELLCGSEVLPRFYAGRKFRLAWSDERGAYLNAVILIDAIREADKEGLKPEDYHIVNLETLLAKVKQSQESKRPLEPESLANFDMLLTDAFLLYGSHLLTGLVNPESIQAEWFIKSRDEDLAVILKRALEKDEIEKALRKLRPSHYGYQKLKKSLLRYRQIIEKGGWPYISAGSKMNKGDRGPRIKALHKHLVLTGDIIDSKKTDPDYFDKELERGVRRFQKRHGLIEDGIVGKATLKALNVPEEVRLRQIKVNLERWRWLPHDLGTRYILVNIANFALKVIEDKQIVKSMLAVVGKAYRRTPVFTGRLTYMVINPYWHIPPSIAKEDMLPKIKENPEYLSKQGIRVFQGWEADAPEIEPSSIDWTLITGENLTFKLRQDPGPLNALGRIKFMFPNKFGVYLHDTPAREVFEKIKRSFSSGCIRVERPIELADYLMKNQPQWNRQKLLEAIMSRETQTILLPEPLEVHLLYWTAWVDDGGALHFRDDIYGRDMPLNKALGEIPPTH